MAVIKPFKGLRYNRTLINDLSAVITPPYDTIDPAEQERLYRKSPFNMVRLEYGKSFPTDNETDNRYTRALNTLQLWLDGNILEPDSSDNYYLYEQTFNYRKKEYRRRGIIAALKLEPYQARGVLPHESTMAGPKKDRLELFRHTRTNVSPILTLFPDPDELMDSFFTAVNSLSPLIETADDSGQTHRLWAADDSVLQDGITAYITSQTILIADGHHRYETALELDQRSAPHYADGSGFILTALFSIKDPGLLMLPTHRLLKNLGQIEKEILKQRIGEEFTLLNRGRPEQLNSESYLAELKKISRERCGFGCICRDNASLLVPENAGENDPPVSILHERLIRPLLAAGIKESSMLHFSHDFDSALEAVVSKLADTAFILEAGPIEEIYTRAARDRLMPQKSTYFYPKLPGGLVLYHMDRS